MLRAEFLESEGKHREQINTLSLKQAEHALAISNLTAEKKKLKGHKATLKAEVIR